MIFSCDIKILNNIFLLSLRRYLIHNSSSVIGDRVAVKLKLCSKSCYKLWVVLRRVYKAVSTLASIIHLNSEPSSFHASITIYNAWATIIECKKVITIYCLLVCLLQALDVLAVDQVFFRCIFIDIFN